VQPNTQYQFSVHFKTDELEGRGAGVCVGDEMTRGGVSDDGDVE